MQLNLIVFLALAVAAILFALQNSARVTVVFLIWRFDASLALVLIACVLVGAALSALIALPGAVRGRLRSRQQLRRIRELEDAIQAQAHEPRHAAPSLANSPVSPPPGAPR
jgi:lipopolysaccharide assembly protein A